MGNQAVATNQLNVSVRIKMLTDADGEPATGITDASSGHVMSYQRGENTALVADGGSAADLALITSAHSDWGLFEIGEGWYRCDFPDAAFAQGKGSVLCTMKTAAESAIGVIIDIGPVKYQGTADSVTATTTTFPSGTVPYVGDTIFAAEGTGVGGEVIITSVATNVATHEAFPLGISATTTTIMLIPGYKELINLDALISSRSTFASGDLSDVTDLLPVALVGGKMSSALSDVTDLLPSALVGGKMNSDLSGVTDLLPSALVNGKMDSNIARINDVQVFGAGTALDKWRGTA